MHPFMLSQLVDDRKDDLAAAARRARPVRRSRRADDETLTRREWRALLRVLQLAR